MEYSTGLINSIKKLKDKKITKALDEKYGIPVGAMLCIKLHKARITPEDIRTKTMPQLLIMAKKLETIQNIVNQHMLEYEAWDKGR